LWMKKGEIFSKRLGEKNDPLFSAKAYQNGVQSSPTGVALAGGGSVS